MAKNVKKNFKIVTIKFSSNRDALGNMVWAFWTAVQFLSTQNYANTNNDKEHATWLPLKTKLHQ